jgi:hypothetical protein
MELGPVVEALQATLSHQLRKQAEDKLAQVRFFSRSKSQYPRCF